MGINEEAQKIKDQRAQQAKSREYEQQVLRQAKKNNRIFRLQNSWSWFTDLFRTRKTRFRRTGKAASQPFLDEFVAWMKKNHVPYDRVRLGWDIGMGGGQCSHGYSPSGSAYGSTWGGEPVYIDRNIYVNRHGVVVAKCNRCSTWTFSTVSRDMMEQRIVQAIANSPKQLSWP